MLESKFRPNFEKEFSDLMFTNSEIGDYKVPFFFANVSTVIA